MSLLSKIIQNPRAKVIDFLCENHNHDYSISEISRKTKVCRQTLYELMPKLSEENLVEKRITGKRNLYSINIKNNLIKLLLKYDFQSVDVE